MNVDPRLFDLYTPEQVDQIAVDLAARQIGTRFNYVGRGAAHWNAMAGWMAGSGTPNSLRSTVDLIGGMRGELAAWSAGVGEVRIVDLGPGDGTPARVLGAALGRVDRYVAVDISHAMLGRVAAELRGRFGPAVAVETHRRDFETDDIADLISGGGAGTVVLLAGGTLLNLGAPGALLRAVRGAMSARDLLVCGVRLDTPASRAAFDFGPPREAGLDPHDRVVLDLLRIDPAWYEPEHGFDPVLRERYIRIRMTRPVDVVFGRGREVRLAAGETVHLWRYHHRDPDEVRDLFTRNGLAVWRHRRSGDGQFLLVVAVRRGGTTVRVTRAVVPGS